MTQGCKLGSFLFSLAIQPLLLRLNKILNNNGTDNGIAIALHDDINIIMNANVSKEIFTELESQLSEIGLTINRNKTKIYSPKHNDAIANSLPQDITVVQDGIDIIGIPIGTSQYCYDYWKTKLIKPTHHSINLVCKWEQTQAAMLLFRYCINSKFNYTFRMNNPTNDFSADLLKDIENEIRPC